jgi:hypothetical protein
VDREAGTMDDISRNRAWGEMTFDAATIHFFSRANRNN